MVKELVPGAWLNVWARMEGRRHAVQLICARPRDCLAVRDGACSRATTHSLPFKADVPKLVKHVHKGGLNQSADEVIPLPTGKMPAIRKI